MIEIQRELAIEISDCYFQGYLNKYDFNFISKEIYSSPNGKWIIISNEKRFKKIINKLTKRIVLQNIVEMRNL